MQAGLLSDKTVGSQSSYQRRLDLAFFLLCPLVLTLLMALVGRYVDTYGPPRGVLYVAALSFVPWWIAGLASQLAHRLLSSYRPPAWLIGAVGVMASVPLIAVYSHAVALWFQAGLQDGIALAQTLPINWLDRVRDVALAGGRATVLWVAFVAIFTATLGWSRYGYAYSPTNMAKMQPDFPLANSGNVWTAMDDRELANLVADGTPPREIARHMKRTVAAIKSRMTKTGLKPH